VLLRTLGIAMLVGTGMWILPRAAYADPHAVFYTDRAQEQLFYNFLAALNQADYVEDPNQPPITADLREGQLIRTGEYIPPPNVDRRVVRRPDGSITVTPPLEPAEAQGVELPRIRVRQVTSDNGDVYYRQRIEARARHEELLVLLSRMACRAATTIYGPTAANQPEYCRTNSPNFIPTS